jgi:uncharacterized circularly permuted ATP-grasp superfamily protein
MASETPYEEDRDGDGAPRPVYTPLLDALDGADLDAIADAVQRHLDDGGVTFGGQSFVVDPIPRLITAEEWKPLVVGLGQRARALNAFLADVYGERRIVTAGVLNAATIEDAEGYEPQLAGRIPAGATAASVIGFDLVRAPDGHFVVLEDNLRTPSGIAYLIAARDAVRAALPPGVPEPQPVVPAILELLGDTLRAAVPRRAPDRPTIVLVTDGPGNVAFYEHRTLARALGILLLTPADLRRRGDRLCAQLPDGSTSSTAGPTRTGRLEAMERRRRSASCSASRGWRARSGWSTTSVTGSPTTSSSTATSRTSSASTSARRRSCARCRPPRWPIPPSCRTR